MTEWANIVNELGEVIKTQDVETKASFKESTRATYSLAVREASIEGQCIKINCKVRSGVYFERLTEDNAIYFINSVMSEPLAEDLVYIYATKCNAEIDIYRYKGKGKNEDGDTIDLFELAHEDVKVFSEVATRSDKKTAGGLLDNTIYNVMLPHQYLVSEGDRIVMKTNIDGEYKEKNYRVDSMSNALVDIGGDGIDMLQLSDDLR